jgi:2-polyprenyl-3-methyl-5-hydroxy-6-metoxy-1,4-benzoquinol methylase
MVNIAEIAPRLRRREDGIWVAGRRTPVSYPEEGSRRFLEIEEDSFWFQHRNTCILAAAGAFPPDGAVFDVGGGNGVVSLALRRAGIEVVLVEPGPEGARNARARGIENVICCTLEDAEVRPRALPAVGLFDVVEHVDDDVGFMREIAQLLMPGGRAYLTCPAYKFLWSVEDEYARHCRRYTRRSLAAMLQSAGFSLEYCTYVFSLLPVPIFLLRTIPSWLGLRTVASRHQEAREHRRLPGPLAHPLNGLLALERGAIRRRIALPFGGSCLAVARAPFSSQG